MSFIQEKINIVKSYLGYSVISLQKQGYSDEDIKIYIGEIEKFINLINKTESTDNLIQFINENIIQVEIEDVKIPVEYNYVKIMDLIKEYGLAENENNNIYQRIRNLFKYYKIEYFIDLHKKTKDDLKSYRNFGGKAYIYFMNCLKYIFQPER